MRVGPRIDRISQKRLQGRPLGTAPLQCPLGRAFAQAHAKLDTLLGKIAHQGMQRAEFVKLAKNEAHHMLHLRIGIQSNGP